MSFVTIIFATIALFFIIRLFTILGTKTGHEKSFPTKLTTETPKTSVNEGKKQIKKIITKSINAKTMDFDQEVFLSGAKYFYETLSIEFVNGNIDQQKAYMSKQIFNTFQKAISQRKKNEQSLFMQFINIEKIKILDKKTISKLYEIKVSFFSNQIRALKDKNGKIIQGSDVRIDLVKDVWIFQRKVNQADPNWVLVETSNQQ